MRFHFRNSDSSSHSHHQSHAYPSRSHPPHGSGHRHAHVVHHHTRNAQRSSVATHPSYLVIIDAHSSSSSSDENLHQDGSARKESSHNLIAEPNPANDDDADCLVGGGSSGGEVVHPGHPRWKSKRALHLADATNGSGSSDTGLDSVAAGSEGSSSADIADGEQASEQSTEGIGSGRPKSRQFFRLGRNRSRGTSTTTSPPTTTSFPNDKESPQDAAIPLVKSLSPPPTGRRRSRSPPKSQGIARLRKPIMRRTLSLPVDLGKGGSRDASLTGTESTSSMTESGSTTTTSNTIQPTSTVIKPTHRRHVTFSSVKIREYSRILGDHPCCPSGPPLSLGWNMEREDEWRLDEYEKERMEPCEFGGRRGKEGMRLDCGVRREILESLVVTVENGSNGSSEGCMDCENDESCANRDGGTTTAMTSTTTCCMYSRAEIRKAERRQYRDRSENHRAHRKMNHRFFRPVVTDIECDGEGSCDGGSSVGSEEEEEEEVKRMDISPIKPRMDGDNDVTSANAVEEEEGGATTAFALELERIFHS
mmetsp:Transcript_12364/g.27014  ORF Transcript_12364/g.27014 Transcript_12364/m.27014 type:complete len:535 (+) Transcript_12364:310-1914(+)